MPRTTVPKRRIIKAVAALAASTALILIGASPAFGAFGIAEFKGSVVDADGDPYTQAGGHPHTASTTISFNTAPDGFGGETADGQVRHTTIELPPGLVGNPTGIPYCNDSLLVDPDFLNGTLARCPVNTQVGTLIGRSGSTALPAGLNQAKVPIYNLEPAEDEPARFAFNYVGVVVTLIPELRSGGDYGLTIKARNINQLLFIREVVATFWGVPSDPAHDAERGDHCFVVPPTCLVDAGGGPGTGAATVSTGLDPRPFLTNPMNCAAGPLTTRLEAESWIGEIDTASFDTDEDNGGVPMAVENCEAVPFSPDIDLEPTTTEADSPSGLDVEITVPQQGLTNPDGLATAHMKRVEVELPEGMAVNPSSADGLGACTPAQIDLDSAASPNCPQSSRIGSVAIETPLLDEDLTGAMYLAEQDQNPFGSLLALYLVAEARGIVIKLPGEVTPDPATGRLTATFDDNPQLPFSKLRVRFKSGPRAPLVTPPTCGTYQITTRMSPWSAADPDDPTPAEVVTSTSTFEIDSGPDGGPCAPTLASRPFGPSMSSGLVNPVAASTSPFVLRLQRADGHQELSSMTVTPPEGLSAYLRGIPLCSDAEAEAGSCPAASKVGRAISGAGAGPSPFYVPTGDVYLTDSYKGAPLGLLVQVPAIAGPFDLGIVDVRAAVHVDERTAQLRVVSDPLPRILEGIPLRIRDIRVVMDRDGFTVAPTNCEEMQVLAEVKGSHGATADLQNRFQVADCGSLSFAPHFAFKAPGKRSTQPNGHPRLTATVAFAEDETTEANIKRASVVLPRRMIVDQDNIATTCTREQFANRNCPEGTQVGFARAHSPLLDDPLQGPVYLIASDNPLPDMVADLRGIIDIALFGRIHSQGIRVRNTFDTVPDAPVSRFQLNLRGGADGILVNGADLCDRARFRRVDIQVEGHNQKTADQRRFIRSKRCARQRVRALERRTKNLRQRARRAARDDNGARAKRLRQRANRLDRRGQRLKRRL